MGMRVRSIVEITHYLFLPWKVTRESVLRLISVRLANLNIRSAPCITIPVNTLKSKSCRLSSSILRLNLDFAIHCYLHNNVSLPSSRPDIRAISLYLFEASVEGFLRLRQSCTPASSQRRLADNSLSHVRGDLLSRCRTLDYYRSIRGLISKTSASASPPRMIFLPFATRYKT